MSALLKNYKKAIKTSVDPENIYYKLGSLYYDHGQYDKAADVLGKASFDSSKKLLAILLFNKITIKSCI